MPDWVLGGGTALMVFADHRLSRDIDAFIDDPQYLALLVSAASYFAWGCFRYLEWRFRNRGQPKIQAVCAG